MRTQKDKKADTPRILIADDHALFRQILTLSLKEAGMEVIATASTGRQAVDATLEHKPDCLLMDIAMPEGSGLDVLHSVHVRKIIKQYVEEHDVTVLLSSHNMLEVEYLCERIAFIDHGKIVAEGTPEKLKTENRVKNLEEAFAKVVRLA